MAVAVSREKYLIINADDFGLDAGINRGIAHSCRHGIVKSVSIVAVGRKFDEAIGFLQDLPGVGAGVHLCLVAERPALSVVLVPSLVGEDGVFFPDYRYFVFRLLAGWVKLREVEAELDAQIRMVVDKGVKPTHLDSHQYLHLIPGIFEIVMKLSVKYGIKWIRYPSLDQSYPGFSFQGLSKRAWLLLFSRVQGKAMRERNICVPDHFFAFGTGGYLDKKMLKSYICQVSEGINDVACHPGYLPENPAYYRWKYRWEREVEALTDPDILRCVNQLGIKLGNYGSIKDGTCR